MKKISILLVLFGLSNLSIVYAQHKNIKVMMADGSLLEGKIIDLNFLKYTEKSKFTIKSKTKTSVDLNDISFIEIEDKGLYESYMINGRKILCYVKPVSYTHLTLPTKA